MLIKLDLFTSIVIRIRIIYLSAQCDKSSSTRTKVLSLKDKKSSFISRAINSEWEMKTLKYAESSMKEKNTFGSGGRTTWGIRGDAFSEKPFKLLKEKSGNFLKVLQNFSSARQKL